MVDNIDFIFEAEDDEDDDAERSLSFDEFMNLVLDMRGSNAATVKDIFDLQKFIKRTNRNLKEELKRSEARTEQNVRASFNCGVLPPVPLGSVKLLNPTAPCNEDDSGDDDYDDPFGGRPPPFLRNAADACAGFMQNPRLNVPCSSSPPPMQSASMDMGMLRADIGRMMTESMISEFNELGQRIQNDFHKEMKILVTQLRIEMSETTLKGLQSRDHEAHTKTSLRTSGKLKDPSLDARASKNTSIHDHASDQSRKRRGRRESDVSSPLRVAGAPLSSSNLQQTYSNTYSHDGAPQDTSPRFSEDAFADMKDEIC